ncbi:MAG: hypothetical protein NVSMB30_01080 [Hymenobacter sp.]
MGVLLGQGGKVGPGQHLRPNVVELGDGRLLGLFVHLGGHHNLAHFDLGAEVGQAVLGHAAEVLGHLARSHGHLARDGFLHFLLRELVFYLWAQVVL